MELQLVDKGFFQEAKVQSGFGTGKPYITLNHSGYCYMSTEAYSLLDLSAGDCVSFHFNKENPSDWYISRVFGHTGYKVSLHTSSGMVFRSQKAVRMIYSQLMLNPKETIKVPLLETAQPAGAMFEIFKIDFNNPLKVMNRGQRPFKNTIK